MSNRTKRLLALAMSGAILLSAIPAYTAINYSDPSFPSYTGNYSVESPEPDGHITVLSYNIWFGQDIDQALAEIKQIQSQEELDIVLLQEMDEVGTEQIARALQWNYIYFPAAIEPTYDKNFGNAILSSWTIVDSRKLILPHKSLSNRMNRIATRATIRVNGTDILVYSIHTESIFTLPRFREDQYRAVVEDMDRDAQFVIVGGDFNSFADADIENVEEIYKEAGFQRVSEGSGNTIEKFGIELSSDHIFAKGFEVETTGKLTAATASDHLPIWVTLNPK